MAYPYPPERQSDDEFFSWLASQGRGAMDFLDESGARANPAAHPPSDVKKIGDAVRSPAAAAAAAAPPAAVDPLTARLEREAAMRDDMGLAANQRSAANLDEVDRAYQRGEGAIMPEASPEEIRNRLGFSWGRDVDVDPATGRPRTNSTISTFDPSQGRTSIAANESQGGGGVSTLGEGPRFRNIQPWQVEDAGRAADVATAERSIEEPLWLQRALAGLDVEKATGIEAGKAGVPMPREQAILAALGAHDSEVDRQTTSDLTRLRNTPEYRGAAPDARKRAEDAAIQHAAEQKQAFRTRFGLATGRATVTFKGDGTNP